MAKIHGKNFAVYVAGVKVGDATDCTLNTTQEIIPVTSKDDDNWEDHIVGTRGWNVSVDFIEDSTNSFSAEDAIDLILNASEVLIEFSTATATDTYYYGQASAENANINAPMGGVNGSITFHGKDALSKAVISAS